VVACVRKKRKVDICVGKSGLARPGAVGMVGPSTCMPHVAHDVKKACWLLACSEELIDIPGERSCLGGGLVVVCVRKKQKVDFCVETNGLGLTLWAW
jgi:hypothetical protein